MRKKTLFALILALPMLFAGCSKDDNSTSGGFPPQYIDFAKINSWIGTNTDDVVNELLQLGFEKEDGDDNYTYLSMEPYYFVSCGTYSTDGIVLGATTQYIINVDSYNITLEAFKDRVKQERQLFNGNNPEYSSGRITWSNSNGEEYQTENFTSYEAMMSAAAGMSDKPYVELLWEDYYGDMCALTVASYGGNLQRIGMNLTPLYPTTQ